MERYHSKLTPSGRARWMLEELDVAYEVSSITFSKGEHKTPECVATHPHGSAPALTDGALTLIGSSAIILHLADTFADKGLAPPLGSDDRARYCRWIVYLPASVDPVLEDTVDGRSFVVGDSFTGADVVVASAIGWVGCLGLLGDHPKLATYLAAMQQRPGYQRAHAD